MPSEKRDPSRAIQHTPRTVNNFCGEVVLQVGRDSGIANESGRSASATLSVQKCKNKADGKSVSSQLSGVDYSGLKGLGGNKKIR